MSHSSETENQLLIPGSYDILSADHRLFIGNCIIAAVTVMDIERVTIGLVPDRALAAKGSYRPFFSYDWRQDDITNWSSVSHPDLNVEFEEFYPGKLLHAPPERPMYRLAALSSEYAGTTIASATSMLAEETIFVPPVDRNHTTDIENALRQERDISNCSWRVGAVLLRDGMIVGQYTNGGLELDSCQTCSKRIDVKRIEDATGTAQPSLVPCDFSHAEMQATLEAQTGDYLLTTTSPCQDCAEAIIDSGIERVAYLKPYHRTQEPISFLKNNDIQIRQAGYHPVPNQ